MRRLTSLLIFSCIVGSIVALTGAALADPIFTWRDAAGGVHFSNRVGAVPHGASEVTLPPLPVRVLARQSTLPAGVARAASRTPITARRARRSQSGHQPARR